MAAKVRALHTQPDLDQLKRQAKKLLKDFKAADPAAIAEVNAHYRDGNPSTFALHDAQLVLARAYGFASWPKLKAFVDGVTATRLADAVRSGDLATVRSMLAARPELVHIDAAENDEHKALHVAVLARQPEIARLLMQHGADANCGIWPHRDATGALTLAEERGYTEIAAIIREEARRVPASSARNEVTSASTATEADRAPSLSLAVRAGHMNVLEDLLDRGFDPDEAGRLEGVEEFVPTHGAPLRECALAGNHEMAALLLARGANANTNVYAASSALFIAYQNRDDKMIALLEQHGARHPPVFLGSLGLVDRTRELLAESETISDNDLWSLLWGAIESPSPEIIRLVLPRVPWPREDPQWHGVLENALYLGPSSDRPRYLEAFRLVLERAHPDIPSRLHATLLHHIAASRGGLTAADRVTYATVVLDAGARLDLRDTMLKSTPLGWACRWGRVELVKLLLERGADPVERDAEPWATPRAWAEKRGYREIRKMLSEAGG